MADSTAPHTSGDNTADLVENWPYDHIPVNQGDDLHNMMEVFAYVLRKTDIQIDELYDNRFIRSATGTELNYLGEAVGYPRRTSETNKHYRFRLQAAHNALASKGTFEDLTSVLYNLFGEQAEGISITTKTGEPVLIVKIPSALIENSPITATTLEEALQPTVSAKSAVSVTKEGSFEFKSGSYTPPSGTGFGEGGFGTLVDE